MKPITQEIDKKVERPKALQPLPFERMESPDFPQAPEESPRIDEKAEDIQSEEEEKKSMNIEDSVMDIKASTDYLQSMPG